MQKFPIISENLSEKKKYIYTISRFFETNSDGQILIIIFLVIYSKIRYTILIFYIILNNYVLYNVIRVSNS